MKKIKIIFFILSLCFLACSKDNDNSNDNDNESYFNLSTSNINSLAETSDIIVNISTNVAWEIISKPNWVSVSHNNGNQNSSITISISENETTETRSGSILFNATGISKSLVISQAGGSQSNPVLSLVSYSGSDGPIKMNEEKYFLFNQPITLNSITSGGATSFNIGPNDVEYFDNNHGIKFTQGPSDLARTFNYTVSVTGDDGQNLTRIVALDFFTQRIEVPGAIKKAFLDENNVFWVLTVSNPSYILKYQKTEQGYVEELRFEIGLDYSNASFVGGDFFINPYNDLIYIPDWEGEEIEVYSKTGSLIKIIPINPVDSDHPQYPRVSPYSIGFNNSGQGILCLAGKQISGLRWRFIDSANDDYLTVPNDSHPYFYEELQSFVLNNDSSKLYVIEGRTSIIKVYNQDGTFDEIFLDDAYPEGADAAILKQNKLNDKIYISGLYNQQIITPDLSFSSPQSFVQFFIGDFSYNPNLDNHIFAFSPKTDVYFKFLDYNNASTVYEFPVNHDFNWAHFRGLFTTSDNTYVLTYSDYISGTPSKSQLVIYDTEMFE